MQVHISRQQRRTLLGRPEFVVNIKLEVPKELHEAVQKYARLRDLMDIGQIMLDLRLLHNGHTYDSLRKGVEVRHKNVDMLHAIELKIVQDLVALRGYVDRAEKFNKSLTIPIPIEHKDVLEEFQQEIQLDLNRDPEAD